MLQAHHFYVEGIIEREAMNINELQKFIGDALQVPVYILNEETINAFEKTNCFMKEVQPYYTMENITLHSGLVQENIFYEIRDLLNTHLILFRFSGESVAIGPFVEGSWDDTHAEELLAKLKLPSTYFVPFKMYYCGFQKENVQTIMRVVSAALNAFTGKKWNLKHRVLNGQPNIEAALDYSIIAEQDFSLVEKRYMIENRFFDSFKSGDVQKIMRAHKNMRPMGAGISYWMTEKYVSEGATAVRTLCRKAAEAAGVNVLVVDAISQEFGQKCGLNRDPIKVTAIMEEMVLRFANAVAEAKVAHYSNPLRRVIDYINLHLSNGLSMKELSEVAGISPSHLSKLFKQETNLTTSEFIANARCEKAAELLRKTELSVQDIAAFVGYIDNNYFVKVFKKWSGKSPTQYRKTNI
ncbi:MAG: transcriptional regulator AraC family [Herbinix sp.]|jgi:AraC-like DNA-binding protein|nr:transcriptional regulator AraC family [Herbinix sp.]